MLWMCDDEDDNDDDSYYEWWTSHSSTSETVGVVVVPKSVYSLYIDLDQQMIHNDFIYGVRALLWDASQKCTCCAHVCEWRKAACDFTSFGCETVCYSVSYCFDFLLLFLVVCRLGHSASRNNFFGFCLSNDCLYNSRLDVFAEIDFLPFSSSSVSPALLFQLPVKV